MNTKSSGVIAFIAGLVVACGGGAIATQAPSPTLQEFNQLKAQVDSLALDLAAAQTDIAEIRDAAFGANVFVSGAGGAATKLSFAAAADTDVSVGTYMGHNATRLSAATTMQLKSPLGYYFEVPTDGGTLGPAPAFLGQVWFEGIGCTGNRYLAQGTAISPYGARQGVVTRTGSDVLDPGSYWMVVQGTPQGSLPFGSRLTQAGVCEDVTATVLSFALVPNDPSVSGVASGALSSDVKVGG